MTLEQKEAKKILNDFINILGDDSVGKAYAKDCALMHLEKLIKNKPSMPIVSGFIFNNVEMSCKHWEKN